MVQLSRTWAFIDEIAASEDVSAVSDALIRIADAFGFTSVFGGLVPHRYESASMRSAEPFVMVQQFPAEWAARYNARNYLFRDPILHRLQRDDSPFTWKEGYASHRVTDDVRTVGGEASEFGLVDGYVFPIKTLDFSKAAVSFGGQRVAIGPDEAAALGFAVAFAAGHFIQLRSPHRRVAANVSVREHDCLSWAAEGKTDWEISKILGISQSTVAKHIASAREKLGAANKTHAVVLAMRSKLMP